MSDEEKKTFLNKEPIETSIAPWLPVNDCTKALSFYKAAFGAEESYRMESPDGVLQVVKLNVDNANFWISEKSDQLDLIINTEAENIFKIILTVTDPDALFKMALEAGSTQVFPVGEEYGWRLGRLVDPFGYHWEIGRLLI